VSTDIAAPAAHGGALLPGGELGLRVIKAARPARELSVREIAHYGLPRAEQDAQVRRWKTRNARHLMRGARRVLAARALGLPHMYGQLFLRVIKADGREFDLGLASMRVVTNNGVAYIVSNFTTPASFFVENFHYHGIGTGTNAENVTDTALQTELTTAYNPDSTRATGTGVVGGSANIFHTVGTNTVDATVAATEHGVFSQAATGGGTLLDRSVYSVVNLASGDSLQSTYDLTFNAGG
jgi:hypothetical protein